ncbi:MAG: hypothetical protein A2W52_00995 [Candidatus Taylorbacteria bacterium RIFCSPHIGHO2_02_49_25]|uniref:N-acetyltransferase domain-containing protein n=1 Tax=Candidatus Taylorbacteria bacterium RIFCSPHIGHO2_02_49_25 TaxID=1802305 RepID=A0A1G2MAM1_9BACT|nr:MAG: GCN5-related N-acetyltransferase [Parcubacteria group bacterium GW2011_GWF2_50_9]OHA20960.1 MAG: hypothetical protein A2W52_00995 [Candidatus Taylorbacteria bacterium RIFCSPHIGHO2_02_49_25]OHA37021.1 MAG: hypothetical protein A3B27_02995 [Candidatus Taylorbacteria bacterium RIFCSPLOWO2_01_FULL_50_130]OHA37259.1 MAG: hypothetical protein A2W65_03240 [Candidatus Taylorbacteria bacterium RIFCSPLOWO2_02_50_13]OHA40023.1 MAG: hypothetical protein A3H73_03580 [Candidatus Taylorbacteria bacter
MENKKAFLKGETVYLRPILKDDLNDHYRDWFNDDEVCRFNSHRRFPNYNEDMKQYYKDVIKSHSNLILAIIDKETDRHIGNISLQNIDNISMTAEFAILIGDKEFWGKGAGKAAGRLIIEHGFDELNLHRIYCGTSIDNVGMQKLAEYLGFKKEGVSRQAMFKDRAFRDVVHYGLLRDEYEK